MYKLRTWLSLPAFADEEKNLTARLMYALLAILVGVTLFLTLPLALIVPTGNLVITSQGLAALCLCAFLFYLLRRGAVRLASVLLVGSFFALNTAAVLSLGGIRASAFTNYMLLIFTAGLLLGPWMGGAIAGLCAVIGLVLVLAEANGLLPSRLVEQTPTTQLIGNLAIFVVVAILQGLSSHMARQAIRRARASEAQYRMLFEEAPYGVCIANADNYFARVNPMACEMLGYAEAETVGRQPADFIAPEDLARRPARTAEQLRALGPSVRERLLVRQDGARRSMLISTKPMPDGRFQYTLQDITERKRAENQIRQYADIVHQMKIGLYVIQADDLTDDSSLRIVVANPAALRASEKTADQVLGRRMEEVFHTLRAKGFPQHYLRVMHTGAPTNLQDTYFDADGNLTDVYSVKVFALSPDSAGVLFENITERVKAEEQMRRFNAELEQRVADRTALLEAANHELEAFSYSISHDLRAPLRGIDGFARILLEEYAPRLEADGQHYLQRVRANAHRMGVLIDDLLQFSRLGRQALAFQTVNTAALVRAALSEFQNDPAQRQMDIVIGGLPDCQADLALLKLVWVNLLSNAFKYTRGCERAHIEIGWTGEAYFVRDNGAGFDMQYVDKLFGVFQRLHRQDEFEGVGVGLANVKRIVERHGGRIWAEAKVHQGATFYFTLPESNKHPLTENKASPL